MPEGLDGLAESEYHLNLAEKLLFYPGSRRLGSYRTGHRNAKAVVKMHATHSLLRSPDFPIFTLTEHLPIPRTRFPAAVSRYGFTVFVVGLRRPIPQK